MNKKNQPIATGILKLEFPSHFKCIHLATEFARESAHIAGFDRKLSGQIALATDEALTNVVKHAYKGQSDKHIKLAAEITDEALILKIFHTGIPLKKSQIKLPDMNSYIKERRVGGLGLFLMTKLMDEIDYTEGREHCCQMKKYRKKGA
ncbi:MAG: hypothetical protein CSA81_09695 [Acidobacteria bacterium]|nr:MAG: hypothetical protein CSA81_09695 [Acidobacteriota bacterium]PIE89365.1 MAG: hypothetical protein CR997_11595 [Acidobacteriota bacterium]